VRFSLWRQRSTNSTTCGKAADTAGDSSMVKSLISPTEMVIKSTAGKSPKRAADSSKSFRPMSCAVSDGGKSLA